MIDKRLLQRVEPSVLGKAFNGLDGPAIGPNGQIAAGVNGPAVEQHGACSAFAAIATNLRSCKAEMIAQKFDQRPPVFNFDAALGAVDSESYWGLWDGFERNLCLDPWRCRATASAVPVPWRNFRREIFFFDLGLLMRKYCKSSGRR